MSRCTNKTKCVKLNFDTDQNRYNKIFPYKFDKYSTIYNDKYSGDRYAHNKYRYLSYIYDNLCPVNRCLACKNLNY